ncbi:hypothetical protein [Pseudorhodoplanes sp.]|uniref:hypothetical protein n=1 Tax=Pseudorhodoplanes sp. TaxID=1934341 RepID=UPI003D14EC7F
MPTDLPSLALSVRQPWAWATVHVGKPLENRSAAMVRHLHPLRGRRAIHAAKGMTREEYEDAREFMRGLGVECPAPADLKRGGIIGSVDVVGVVSRSDNPWFFGPRALVLDDPRPCEFVPAIGALGYFAWSPADPSIVPGPARWMLPRADHSSPDLFGGGR